MFFFHFNYKEHREHKDGKKNSLRSLRFLWLFYFVPNSLRSPWLAHPTFAFNSSTCFSKSRNRWIMSGNCCTAITCRLASLSGEAG